MSFKYFKISNSMLQRKELDEEKLKSKITADKSVRRCKRSFTVDVYPHFAAVRSALLT
jgi:hypothetical protein